MQEKKALKNCLKRKLKITEALLVSILIFGGISYSTEIENDVGVIMKKEHIIDQTDETRLLKEDELANVIINSHSSIINDGIIESNVLITRSLSISSATTNSTTHTNLNVTKSGNGIFGDDNDVKNQGIINSRVLIDGGNLSIANTNVGISSATSSSWSGNGIFGDKSTDNTGIISGSTLLKGASIKTPNTTKVIESNSFAYGSGNGIYEGNIQTSRGQNFAVSNNGIIRGNVTISGSSVNSNSNSLIESNFSGNGLSIGNHLISNSSNTLTATLNSNSGIIRGNNILTGSTIIVPDYTVNKSSIAILSKISGNGIAVGDFPTTHKGTITISENTGLLVGQTSIKSGQLTNISGSSTSDTNIVGDASLKLVSSANGIVSDSIDIASNKGIIYGKAILIGGEINITANEYSRLDASIVSNNSGNGAFGNNFVDIDMNKGIISGYITAEKGTINKNSGTANAPVDLFASGNGIYGGRNINSEGNISGYALGGYLGQSGNGIYLEKDPNFVINKGVVKGNQHAIAARSKGTVNNYGVLAGQEVYFSDYGYNLTTENYGIELYLKPDINGDVAIDSNGNVQIDFINIDTRGAIIDGKTVINATNTDGHTDINDVYFKIDTPNSSNNNTIYNNAILNGIGNQSGTLTVSNNISLELTNTIVNSYKTAITLDDGSTLTASDSIFNGGGLKNEDPIIETFGNNVTIDLNGASVVNGNTLISGSNSTMSISNETQINGNIESKGADNRLELGDENSSGINFLTIYSDIEGFDNIDTRGSVMLLAESSIDKGTITVKEGSTLIVDLDGTSRDSNDYVTGHALYNHTGEIILESPEKYIGPKTDLDEQSQVIFRASGLGEDTIIAMNGTDVSSINDYYLGTYSIAHTARKLNDNDGNVIISVKNFDDIFPDVKPDPTPKPFIIDNDDSKDNTSKGDTIEHREDIKKVYNEIKESGQIAILAPTTDTADKRMDAKSELMSILDQIYANNPYAFVGEASKEAIDLFRNSHQYIEIPEKGDSIVSGSAISSYSNYHDVEMNNIIDGKDSINRYSRNTTTVGGLGDVEYGLGNKASLGFLLGGANQKVDMSHNSELDGDILYLGLYHRKEIKKYTFETGAGYQYASYDVTREISNKYQTIKNEGDVESNSIVLYEDIRYLLKDENGWKVEPKLSLTAIYINQDSTQEKKSDLSINVGSKDYNYFDTEVGVEITKENILEKGKLKTKGSLSYINSQGSSKEKISSNFSQGGEKFDILGPELSTNNGKIGLEVTYEKSSGIDYFTGIDYKVGEKKRNTTSGKIGINYKF